MALRLALIVASGVIPAMLLASENVPNLSAFPDAGKSLEQLARESVDRQIAASVQGKRPQPAAPLAMLNPQHKILRQRARSEECSIPLLESKIEHPERFSMKTLKLPPSHADRMAVPPPAPACRASN